MIGNKDKDELMLVQLTKRDLKNLIKEAINEQLKERLEKPKNTDEYFDGYLELAKYLRVSYSKARKIVLQLPRDAYLRVGQNTRVYKWAIDDYLQGRFKP